MRQGTSWTDQSARILRWKERVRQTRDDGRSDSIDTEGYRDEVFALFQAIWHLKDWIRKDPAVDQAVRDSVEGWVEEHGLRLKVAADVANGSKHMTLSSGRAGGSAQTRNDTYIHVGSGVIRHTFYIEDRTASSDHEAVALADLCIQEWEKFLGLNGLEWPG